MASTDFRDYVRSTSIAAFARDFASTPVLVPGGDELLWIELNVATQLFRCVKLEQNQPTHR